MLSTTCSSNVIFFVWCCSFFSPLVHSTFNLTLHHQHPFPQHVVPQLNRRVNVSVSRRQTLESEGKEQASCVTGNPIDDCWRCDPNWINNRQHLADCAIGFGSKALGGKGGPIYVVTDSSDPDPDRLKTGTLRDAVSQAGPVWITFAGDMVITLKRPLMVTSFKTIDGRGAHVEITGGGCISIEHVTNVIVHNINIHDCKPANCDGDAIHIEASRDIWIDHCELSHCYDGLVDCTIGSTAITISNNYLHHHDKVMLFGHSDEYTQDRGMQVTVAFNRFGEALDQRMPRCRFGFFHIVNNDYKSWGEYAVGGSSSPTINSQGNRYIAPSDPNAKQVTKRMDSKGREWEGWNWRSEGDEMVNGAFFVPSGDGVNSHYTLASSVDPRSAAFIDQLTLYTGLLLPNGGIGVGIVNPNPGSGGVSAGGGGVIPGGFYTGGPPGSDGGDGGYFGGGGWIFSHAPLQLTYQTFTILFILIIFTFIMISTY